MESRKKLQFKATDVPLVEAPDRGMTNTVIINEETCGATAFTAGILYVPPGGKSVTDIHQVDEFYYIIGGSGTVTVNGVPHQVQAGDLLFLPARWEHRITNEGNEIVAILWVTGETWGRLPEIRDELAKWAVVRPAGS
jgi:mannose-6-phosphate isomerase-like protein (cupin superfamily)